MQLALLSNAMTFIIKCASSVQILHVKTYLYMTLVCSSNGTSKREHKEYLDFTPRLNFLSWAKPSHVCNRSFGTSGWQACHPSYPGSSTLPATCSYPPLVVSVWGVWIQGLLGGFSNAFTYTHKCIHGCVTAAHIIKSKGNFPSLWTKLWASFWKCHECNKE